MKFRKRWLVPFAPLLRVLHRTDSADLGLMAAGVAFFGFFSMFPALAAIIALWGFAFDPSVIREQVNLLNDVVPAEAFVLISGQVDALVLANSRHLGWATLISTLLAFWSARAGVAAMIIGLNAIHGLPARHSFGHLIRTLILTLALIALALAASIAAVVGPLAIALLPLGRFEALALEAANLGVAIGVVVLAIGLLYRFGPNHDERHKSPRLFTWGLLVALLLWIAVSRGFVIYLANFNAYNQIYGSIGAVIALMTWLYLSVYAIFLGAAIDAERGAQ